MRLIIIVTMTLLFATNTSAREIGNMLSHGEKALYTNFEFDPTFMIAAGYVHGLEIGQGKRQLALSTSITAPIFLADPNHIKADVSSRVQLWRRGSIYLQNRLGLVYKRGETLVSQTQNLSVEEGLLLGFHRPNWYIATELAYHKYLAADIEHSDWYRKVAYSDAQDGWFLDSGGQLLIAIQGAYQFRNIEVTFRLGQRSTEKLNPILGPAFFINQGVALRF